MTVRFFLILSSALLALIAYVLSWPVFARDAGRWAGESPEVQQWFEGLRLPGSPYSCCGLGDGYPVSHWEADGADFKVTLDDGRVFSVRHDRLLTRETNPTGRPILFLSGQDADANIYCFVMGPEI